MLDHVTSWANCFDILRPVVRAIAALVMPLKDAGNFTPTASIAFGYGNQWSVLMS
jgi:hypothetical protein